MPPLFTRYVDIFSSLITYFVRLGRHRQRVRRYAAALGLADTFWGRVPFTFTIGTSISRRATTGTPATFVTSIPRPQWLQTFAIRPMGMSSPTAITGSSGLRGRQPCRQFIASRCRFVICWRWSRTGRRCRARRGLTR